MHRLKIICLLLFSVILNVTPAKLNVPRVLLPLYQHFSTNFTLEVSENGCYQWSSSRPDIVQVIPIEVDEISHCSIKAIVSAVTKEPIRNTVIVLAEQVRTGFILRCDVIVDTVSYLNIVTTTRELFMEEAPEMFEVRASDNQGNEFTTLEGVEFQWSIENMMQSSSANQVLRFITFIDSPYETPHTVAKFDSLGLRGHMVLIEGVKTGAAKVSVRLPQPEYREVPKVEVLLTVVANLLLDPPDSHILAGDTVKFRLLQMQHGKLDELALPYQQYRLEVEDKAVITIDPSVSVVRGLRLGQSRVRLVDSLSPDSEGGVRLPTATVTVTEAAYLRLVLAPYNNWAVLVEDRCTIQVQVYDRNNHRIHVGDAVTVTTIVSEEYFRVWSMTRNGTIVDGEAIKVGTVPVTATLASVRAVGGQVVELKPAITVQEEMLIYPRLDLIPPHVVVPWDLSIAKCQMELRATGGDGSYSWRSLNSSLVTVTQTGVIRCHSLGETSVVVSMSRNPAIKASSLIEVLPPSHIEILKHVLEAPVLKPVVLHVVLYADRVGQDGHLERVPFTDCQSVQFKVDILSENFLRNNSDLTAPVENACATITLYGKTVGTSKVRVWYKAENVLLEASTDVAAFSPLLVVHPEKKKTVLALGTSRHVVWKGGPRVWLGKTAEHVRSITTDSDNVKVEEVPSNSPSDLYVYSVTCHKLGEYLVKLSVKNSAGEGHHEQLTESSSTVKVICAKPRFVTLTPETPLNATCPYSADVNRIVALSHEPVTLLVTVSDAQGRVFDNATSLHVDWCLSPKSLAHVQFEGVLVLEEKKEFNYLIPLNHYQIVHPKNRTGTLKVEAIIDNYRLHLLSLLRIEPESPAFWIEDERGLIAKPVIKNALSIIFVNMSTVVPDRVTVFNHPNNRVLLQVTQGSGFYTLRQSSLDIAEVHYQDSSKSIEVIPKSDGVLQLIVQDLCLTYPSSVVEIQVLKVGSIQVDMVERVQKGDVITATVWLYDSVDNSLSVGNSELLELKAHIHSDIVSISRLPFDITNGQVKFNITGLDLGNTMVTFSSGYGEREIRSQPQPLQVFPPLQLIPSDLTLAVGAVFQLTPTGGPLPDCAMDYVSSDPAIAKVDSAGVVEAQKIGDTPVTGLAVGNSKSTRAKIVYSQDVANIHVIPLEGVKIYSPLLNLKVGCTMPVWATGVPDKITPLILGSIQPSLVFKWSTSTPDVVELKDVFHSTGLEVPDRDRLSMRVVGLKPGRVSLQLNVTMKIARYGMTSEFYDHMDLEIFEELKVIKPEHHKASTLLMSPYSQMQLRTNKDSVTELSYSVVGSSEGGWSGGHKTALTSQAVVVAVNRAGLVKSHTALGSATVLVTTSDDHRPRQTLAVNVEVKPVHYIMLNVNTRLHSGSNKVVSALPRGLDLDLTISYHDNTGEAFAAARTDVHTLQNRADTIKIVSGDVNGTLISKLSNYGTAILKIWDESTPKTSEEYIKLRVDHLISPSKSEVTVGDVVCFSMSLEAQGGRWTCDRSDVVSLSGRGVARALRPGTVFIKYSLTPTISSSVPLAVHAVHAMVFLPLNGRNLTNWGSFSASLVLRSEHDAADKMNNLLAKDHCAGDSLSLTADQFPFACEIRFNSPMTPVDINHVFTVQPRFSMQTGLYSCYFEALHSLSPNTSVLTSNVTLRAISEGLVSEPLVIPFLPSVFLPMQTLVLSDRQTWAQLPVIGIPPILAHVQVFSSDVSYMTVDDKRLSDSNTAVFSVSIDIHTYMGQPSHPLHLYVISPLTGQNITVAVSVRADSVSAPCIPRPSSPWTLLESVLTTATLTTIICLLIILYFLCYSSLFSFARPSPMQSSIYATSTPTSMGSPLPGSPHRSPGSPYYPQYMPYPYRQPFSDTEPVYGDPNLSHSPELNRRNHR